MFYNKHRENFYKVFCKDSLLLYGLFLPEYTGGFQLKCVVSKAVLSQNFIII